ncbi:hypothetical protein Natgr_0161 [Natronobacterium gregoryi SP2]|uniref:Uncharacterized protein n=1 Tax=Natronobacterium gregoryi (strain ATCC 43098 / DSM 3393 / CCM 3738 / CIP 104747 / IAM 13177 / JCM 8860 / NBRC 102187 / NCIMB 2189 / SP2) TaxID=797304 RepID=L0AED8_NATGS|nr:hypothetical protein Natgr_0161 [Natronobacterium gregoryi SP2]
MLPLLRVIDVKAIVVTALIVVGLYLVLVEDGAGAAIVSEMLAELSPF